MARIRNQWHRYQNNCGGEYASLDVDLDAQEASTLAKAIAALTGALTTLGGVYAVFAPLLAKELTDLMKHTGLLGVTVHIEGCVGAVPSPPTVSFSGIGVEGSLLKTYSDPKVYVVQGGQLHFIPNQATFNANGFNWAFIVCVSDAELKQIPMGKPIPSVTGKVIRVRNAGPGLKKTSRK